LTSGHLIKIDRPISLTRFGGFAQELGEAGSNSHQKSRGMTRLFFCGCVSYLRDVDIGEEVISSDRWAAWLLNGDDANLDIAAALVAGLGEHRQTATRL